MQMIGLLISQNFTGTWKNIGTMAYIVNVRKSLPRKGKNIINQSIKKNLKNIYLLIGKRSKG